MRTRTIIAGMTPLQLAEHVEVLLELSKVLGEEALVDEPQHISTLRTVVQNAIEVVCPTNNALRDVQELLMRELGLTSPPVRNGRAPSPSPSPSRQSSLPVSSASSKAHICSPEQKRPSDLPLMRASSCSVSRPPAPLQLSPYGTTLGRSYRQSYGGRYSRERISADGRPFPAYSATVEHTLAPSHPMPFFVLREPPHRYIQQVGLQLPQCEQCHDFCRYQCTVLGVHAQMSCKLCEYDHCTQRRLPHHGSSLPQASGQIRAQKRVDEASHDCEATAPALHATHCGNVWRRVNIECGVDRYGLVERLERAEVVPTS
jgi:hypothetical protein